MLRTEQLDAPRIVIRLCAATRVISAFSFAQHLDTTPWWVNEIQIATVFDAKPGTGNHTHKLNSKFICPFGCASQLWI